MVSTKPTAILGISAYYRDSAAALVVDGEIVAAAPFIYTLFWSANSEVFRQAWFLVKVHPGFRVAVRIAVRRSRPQVRNLNAYDPTV